MPKPLPFEVFLRTFKYAPRTAASLIVENKKGEVLLARRAISPGKGSWHMPGSFILKGESIGRCVERVAKNELGLKIKLSDTKLLGAFDNLDKDPRGHVIDLVYRLTTTAKPKLTSGNKELEFFSELPRNIGFNHKATLKNLGY